MMKNTMASLTHQLPLLLTFVASYAFVLTTTSVFSSKVSMKETILEPFKCSTNIKTCNASLYHITYGDNDDDQTIQHYISSNYTNSSQIRPITRGTRQDHLITVPCSCRNNNNLTGYYYDTTYTVKPNDNFYDINNFVYSGQAMLINGVLYPGQNLSIHIPCGCSEIESQIVVTYTVQRNDTSSGIAKLLNSTVAEMESVNHLLDQNPSYIDVGWVLFVPSHFNGIPLPPTKEKKPKWQIIIGVLVSVTLLSMIAVIFLILRRNRDNAASATNNPKSVNKRSISKKNSDIHKEYMQVNVGADATSFESERPVIYSIEEIEDATNNFDENRRIGVGGYGSVYFGMLGHKEVAVKKMKSNKSKEFFAELKALCKIHHINIVELLGYASGDDHLYLVYEYVANGSLSDHLHDPLLKGHQALSWCARTQIALDAAKGIEYIHDYTKAQYVHRDIKTTNILLDQKLRAKVADFGLAKLVERTNDEEFIATRLVGTPGYLPPESVKELQVTIKTDVFAFGVVLSELITGRRALFRDSQKPNQMESLISLVKKIFQDNDPVTALENVTDMNLQHNYPIDAIYKMGEIAEWCMREEPMERPEMKEIVGALSKIVMTSIEWEASLGGDSQVFSGVFIGR
ncbi:lysM domain receptor-like kinase 3 isoform X1 [Arachis stenosperma]|uniref:lysM domain receptor-like kinase 3 isoform X1 n=1 Tax=Arachis stenosperma TaxID=217475 RepID=UPI0025AC73C8|nr:lysM domain receptor-like kinase 3 isoform X1 [Arachis stenosperma]